MEIELVGNYTFCANKDGIGDVTVRTAIHMPGEIPWSLTVSKIVVKSKEVIENFKNSGQISMSIYIYHIIDHYCSWAQCVNLRLCTTPQHAN